MLLVDCAGLAHVAVLVILLLAVGEVAHRGIDEDIAWARVKVVEFLVQGTAVRRPAG